MKGFSSSQRRRRGACAAAARPGTRGASPPASQHGGDIPGSDGPVAEETRLISTKPRWLKATVGMGGEPRGEFIHSSQKNTILVKNQARKECLLLTLGTRRTLWWLQQYQQRVLWQCKGDFKAPASLKHGRFDPKQATGLRWSYAEGRCVRQLLPIQILTTLP